jgi:hypothetical protein
VPPTGLEGQDTEHASGPETDIGGPTTTGVPAVDHVLADVDRLDEVPVEEHLGAFERAHDSLRAALDAPPSDQAKDRPHHRPGDPA